MILEYYEFENKLNRLRRLSEKFSYDKKTILEEIELLAKQYGEQAKYHEEIMFEDFKNDKDL